MTYAVAQDVTDRLGRALTDAETSQVPTLLADVESTIRGRITDLDAQITASTINQATVIKVEAWAVVRFLKNPDGKYQEALSNEYSFTRDKAVSSGLLYITDDEWDEILPSTVTSSAFNIVPAGLTDNPHARWCDWRCW